MADFKFLQRLSAVPKLETNIYTLKKAVANEKSLLETARKFKLQGNSRLGKQIWGPNEITYVEGAFQLTLYPASGAIKYLNTHKWQVDVGQKLKIPDEEGVKIAQKFIAETALASSNEFRLLKVTRLTVGTLVKGAEKGDERVIDLGVVFQRYIGKVPVEGPGGKLIVFIDHEGQVTGCRKIWRDIETVKTKIPFGRLRTPQFAEEDLIKYWKPSGFIQVEVSECRFGYFEMGHRDKQIYLQPAYVQPIQLFSRDQRIVSKTVHVTPASSTPPVQLMPPFKKFVEQPKRK